MDPLRHKMGPFRPGPGVVPLRSRKSPHMSEKGPLRTGMGPQAHGNWEKPSQVRNGSYQV